MKKIILVIILIAVCLGLYGHFIEINNIKVNHYTITNKNITDSFKELTMVHFSDILYKHNEDALNDIIVTINNEKPDIVIFTGDLFYKDEEYKKSDLSYIKENLKKINASLYKFAVVGDNDKKFIDKYKDILYESDFIFLDNENKLVFYKDLDPILFVGLSDTSNISSILESDTPYKYSIAITHKPDDITEISKHNINTLLTGHSLGGIINVPYYGGIIKKDGANKYINGYYKVNDTEMYISNGLGNESYDFRLFNTPSINVYRFDN